MKILFLVPYPPKEAPSQRFRFEQYLEMLKRLGHDLEVQSFLSSADGRLFYESSKYGRKLIAVIKGFVARFFVLFSVGRYDFVFIHREATPLGPPVIEWMMARVMKKKIIYDFDDAIWLSDKVNENRITKMLKWRSKVGPICKWSWRVSCGNEFLRDFALQFNPHSIVNPTTIDALHLEFKNPKEKPADQMIIGWTGSFSTLKYLKALEPALQILEKKYPQLQFLVVADKKPDLKIESLIFSRWSKETEIDDLARMDIGVMPLEDDLWSRGKCGFKALQYMATEVPALVSPVGVNLKIVQDGVNGYLCKDSKEWIEKLSLLIEDSILRNRLGKAARQTVLSHYSVSCNAANFLSLFD